LRRVEVGKLGLCRASAVSQGLVSARERPAPASADQIGRLIFTSEREFLGAQEDGALIIWLASLSRRS
jgi:hypothetical protein